MNKKIWIILGVSLGLGGLAIGGYFFFRDPPATANAKFSRQVIITKTT